MADVQDHPVLEVKRTFAASPSVVFEAWMNREQWQAWIGPEGMFCEVPLLEPIVGGNFQIKMKISAENIIPVIGVYREIEKPTRIAFTWGRADSTAPHSLITVTLKNAEGKTALTLSHEGLGSPESRDSHGRGWNDTFNKLERYLLTA